MSPTGLPHQDPPRDSVQPTPIMFPHSNNGKTWSTKIINSVSAFSKVIFRQSSAGNIQRKPLGGFITRTSEGAESVGITNCEDSVKSWAFWCAMTPLQIAGLASFVLPFVIYIVFLVVGSIPFFQRQFLYANNINTLFRDDLEVPETWGFAHKQVTSFNITTGDGESLYAWHILPLSLYSTKKNIITAESRELRQDITQTEGFRMLKKDANRKVIIYFHGNAGHIANGWRPQTYHALTGHSDYHVIAFDYRGFGKSTGRPSEDGLIQDAKAVIDWVMMVTEVPPENIVLFGHSLGTAVVSAALEHYSNHQTTFAGTLLVAPFSNLPTLLSRYRILGTFPVLGPLAMVPRVQRWMQSMIWEKWPSVERLTRTVKIAPSGLRITLLHALDDWDIPCSETDTIFHALALAMSSNTLDRASFDDRLRDLTIVTDDGGAITTWVGEPDVVVRRVMFPYGSHNLVSTWAPMILETRRFFYQETKYE